MTRSIHAILFSVSISLLIACGDDTGAAPMPTPLVYTKSDHGIPWATANYEVFQDARDGQLYRAVTIGKQTWMAENLNFRGTGTDSGFCHAASSDTCAKYGRLYTWSAAMAEAASSSLAPSGVRGVCPAGWHLPSIPEWDTLVAVVERDPSVGAGKGGVALKTTARWKDSIATKGTDRFGFRGLPSGYRYEDATFKFLGTGGGWWTSTLNSPTQAFRRDLGDTYNTVYRGAFATIGAFTVRCVKD